MAEFPKQGETFSYALETALGTDDTTWKDIRFLQDTLAYPGHTRELLENANAGHRHAYYRSDKPIPIQAFYDGGLSLSSYLRRSASANTAPPLADFLESAGWNIDTTTVTTVASYSSTTQWDLGDTGDAYGLPGNFILVKIEDGTSSLDEYYYPVLIGAKSSDTVTPGMALPAATANAEPIEVMTTMFPRSRIVPATKTLSFLHSSRVTHTSGEDLTHELAGCALKSLGSLVLEPNMAPTFELSFHVGTVDQQSTAIAAESFVCGEKYGVITDACRVELANSNTSGGIARSDAILRKAEIDFGFECVPRTGYGSGTLAGLQGYVLRAMRPSITLTAEFSKDYWDDVEGANTAQYLAICQPTSDLATPAFAVCMPRCHIEDTLTIDRSGDVVTATVTYVAETAGYNSETDNDDMGAAPIYLGISGASS